MQRLSSAVMPIPRGSTSPERAGFPLPRFLGGQASRQGGDSRRSAMRNLAVLFSGFGPRHFIFFSLNITFLLTRLFSVTIHEIEYALRQPSWREFQKVRRRIEWQQKRKQRRRGKLFVKFERNYRGCSDASPKFFMGFFLPVQKLHPLLSFRASMGLAAHP